MGIPRIASAAGEREEAITNIEVSIVIDGKPISETWINLSAGGTGIEIPAAPVLSALKNMVSQETIRSLESQITVNGTFTNKILARFGVTLGINVPMRQVYLATRKSALKMKTETARSSSPVAAPDSGHADTLRAAAKPGKAKDSAGPWTSPPVPPLPGRIVDTPPTPKPVDQVHAQASNGGGGETYPLTDTSWEPMREDTSRAGAPQSTGSPGNPSVQLKTYRLDRTREELFEDVFKRKAPPLPASVEVTLLVDGKSYGTLWILYNEAQKRYTFPVDPVLNALQGLVRPDLWEKLAARAKAQSRFTVEDLIACGFPTVLNTTVFELSTGVPAQLLGSKMHPVAGQVIDPYTVPAYEPGWLSAFINTRIRERLPYYQYNPSPFDTNGFGKLQVEARNQEPREPVNVDLDGAINLKTWVVEGRASLLEKPVENRVDVHRQDIRLVHDWPKQSLRLNVGDLIFPTTGFQSFWNLGGVGLSRDFSLQPHLVAYPVKDFEFFLTNPSEVRVFINGVLRGTFQLEQGTHDLQGFPFTAGESEVEIKITDNTGQTQTLNFDFIHEPSLLAKGISAFSFNVGFPSRDIYNPTQNSSYPDKSVLWNYEYDQGNPALFLDYKLGMSNSLTMEAYSQAMDTVGMIGLDLLQAIKIGKIKTDLAGSYHHRDEFAWAGNLEYTYIPKITSDVSPTSWRIKSEYIEKGFYRLGQDSAYLGALSLAGSFQKYTQILNLNLGASYVLRLHNPDFYNLYAGLSRSWPKGWSSSLTFKNTFDRAKSTNTSVAATLNYFFNFDVQSFNASERVENHQVDGSEKGTPPNWDYSTDLLWDYNGAAPFPHNPSLNMTTNFGPNSNDYSARAQWNGNQGTAEIMGRRYEPKTQSIITNYADLTLQSSLIFVDGNFALSRPVRNSFVMVKGIENEEACDILVNPNEMGYDAKSSNWFPGVVPTVSPYYLKKIHLEVQDPPLGSNDDRTDFTIYPGYKSGYAIYMGTKSTIIALGTLMLGQEKPAEYQTFQAIPLGGETRDPVVGFTNKVGKFQLTRMQPGKYRIEMYVDGKAYATTMSLPKKSEGITTLGTLLLAPR